MGLDIEIPEANRLKLHKTPRGDSHEAFLAEFDLERVPKDPGCYIMHDAKEKVVYVGKAKNLRSRIRTYVNEQDSRYSVKFLMRRVASIDFLVTTNEKEALLLENSLIKQFRPRYNVRLKDDKNYVSLRLNVKEDFPRITVVRKHAKDGARYFGPYSSAKSVRETMRQIHRMFPLRTCTDNVMHNRTRPCLYYQMGRCVAPCVDYVDRDAYHEIVEQVALVLEGRNNELEKRLLDKIDEHVKALEFEKAATLRDRLYALRRTLERQRTVAVPGAEDRDVFGAFHEGRFSEIQVLFFRGGKMVGGRSYTFKEREMPVDELMSSFLMQFYAGAPVIPREVLVPVALEDAGALGEILTEMRGAKVSVLHPRRGEKKALLVMADRNARTSFDEKRLQGQAQTDLLEQVRCKLKLREVPQRIECFDISTTQGAKSVGSMVVFEGGLADKNRYRKYSIKGVEGQDDFASMREVLLRRYKRAIEEDDLPDLVLVDGGKGQLNVARAALKDLGVEDLETVSIAKSRAEGDTRSPERFFIPGRSNPIILPQNDPVVLLMSRIRDEAHRFAITYHRKRRQKSAIRTALTDIPGVGPKRAAALLNKLGSVAKIHSASVAEIAALPGFDDRLAQTIKGHLSANAEAGPSGDNP